MSATKTNPPFGVVILGAGASARMGRPKLLLPWGDTTVIGQIIRHWRGLDANQIAIVVRPNDTELSAELDRLGFPAQDRIENPQPERGMFSSILCAANWHGWRKDISIWAIVLGDQPHLRLETLRVLLNQAAQTPDAICQPQAGDRARHPVILPRKIFDELQNTGAETLKDFLKLFTDSGIQVVINDPGLTLDLDTPEDYIQLQSSMGDT
jgi:molybdenum cofactor cytidylyltransferase